MTTMPEIQDCNGNGSFSTYGWKLLSRDCPVPERKRTLVSLPYADGAIDFSHIDGRQRFNARECTYTFRRSFDGLSDMETCISGFVTWLYAFDSGATSSDSGSMLDTVRGKWLFKSTCISCEVEESAGGYSATCTAKFEALDPYWHKSNTFPFDTGTIA